MLIINAVDGADDVDKMVKNGRLVQGHVKISGTKCFLKDDLASITIVKDDHDYVATITGKSKDNPNREITFFVDFTGATANLDSLDAALEHYSKTAISDFP